MEELDVAGIAVRFNPNGGMLDRVSIIAGGRTIEPLHRAPWIDSPDEVPADDPPHLRWLAGDFFCAPFAKSDVEPSPNHGWAANGFWVAGARETAADGALSATFALDHRILGATLTKEIILRPGQPVVYQRHVFTGGKGGIPIAHHAMIRVPGGARLSFSPKEFGATPPVALEPDPAVGRSILAYPQRFADLSALKLGDGTTVDARTYPFTTRHEDFLTLFDPPSATIGWSAALAKADGFLFFAVKDARLLPQTSLWMSNGGRSVAPWSWRHDNVLGIEESCTHYGSGHRVSAAPNDLSEAGYRTSVMLSPDKPTVVRYALGAIPADPAWSEVTDIALADGALILTDAGGAAARVPFDTAFFAGD